MKKIVALMMLPFVLCSSCMAHSDDSNFSKQSYHSSQVSKDFLLFVNQNNIGKFSVNNGVFSIDNILLEKGDVVSIKNNGINYFSADSYSKSSYFIKKQNAVEMSIEGIYRITIENDSVIFTRISSIYQSFTIKFSDGSEKSGNKIDDFSFQILSVHISFRQTFSLYLNQKKVTDADIDLKELENCISISSDGMFSPLQSGDFSFFYDARKEKCVYLTSDSLCPPASLLTNKEDYRQLVSSFSDSKNDIVSIESKSLVEDKINKTKEEKEIRQESYINESSYSVSTRQNPIGNDFLSTTIVRCFDSDNYYSLEQDDDTVSLLDAKVISQPIREYPNGYASIVDDVISLQEAKKQVSSFSPEFDTLSSILSSLLVSKHISSSNPMTEEETKMFESSFFLSSQYVGENGSSQKIQAFVFEKSKGLTTSSAVKDEVSLLLSEDGTLISGDYCLTYYQDSPSLLLEDYSLSSSAKISKIESGSFSVTYGTRTQTQNFKLNPKDYVATVSSLTFAEDISLKAGGELFDIQNSIFLSSGSFINKGDFRVMAYDPEFFYPGVGNDKYLYTRNKGGKTKIYVGTKYDPDIMELDVEILLNDATSVSLKGQDGRTDFSDVSFEISTEYKIEASAFSGQNPCFSVSSNHDDIVKVKECSSRDESLENQKTTFTLSFLKEGTASVTVQSLSNANVKKVMNITVTKPVSLEKYKGTYYSSSYGTLKISEDGNAIYIKDGKTYGLRLSLVKDMLVLVSSDEITTFEASISIYNEKLSLPKFLVKLKTKDGKIDFSYVSFYQGFPLFENECLKSGEATLMIQNYKVSYSTSKFHGILKDDGHTLEFDFNMDSTSSCYMDDSYVLDGNEESYQLKISSYEVKPEFISLSFSGSGYFAEKSYSFGK